MLNRTFAFAVTLLACLASVRAQTSLGDLPDCAVSCVNEALKSVGCESNDLTCFCANPILLQNSENCVGTACRAQTRGYALGVLAGLCVSTDPPPSSSSSQSSSASSSPSSSAASSTSQSASGSSSITSSATSTPSSSATSVVSSTTPPVTRVTPPASVPLAPTTSRSQSGTVVVIQTVNLPDPSQLIGAASSLVSNTWGPTGTILSVGVCALAGTILLVF